MDGPYFIAPFQLLQGIQQQDERLMLYQAHYKATSVENTWRAAVKIQASGKSYYVSVVRTPLCISILPKLQIL